MTTYVFDAILTLEEECGYSVAVPALPGCFTCGDDYDDAVRMAVDAARTWVASTLRHGEPIPARQHVEAPAGSECVCISFEVSDTD